LPGHGDRLDPLDRNDLQNCNSQVRLNYSVVHLSTEYYCVAEVPFAAWPLFWKSLWRSTYPLWRALAPINCRPRPNPESSNVDVFRPLHHDLSKALIQYTAQHSNLLEFEFHGQLFCRFTLYAALGYGDIEADTQVAQDTRKRICACD
jgi:hypothetical protein